MSDEDTSQMITLYNVSDHAMLMEFQAAYLTEVLLELQFWFQLQHNLEVGRGNKSSVCLQQWYERKIMFFS